MARVVIEPEGTTIEVSAPLRVSELLASLGLSSEEAVVLINGTPVPEQAVIEGEDEVRVLRVRSSG